LKPASFQIWRCRSCLVEREEGANRRQSKPQPKQELAMGNIVSCQSGSPFPREANKMISELHEQSGCDNNAGSIRRDEARVMNDLQNGSLIVLLKTSLVKCFAAITQRMIHINEHVAISRSFGVNESNAAWGIFRYFGTCLPLMRKCLQGDTVRLIVACRPHDQLPGSVHPRKCLRSAQCV